MKKMHALIVKWKNLFKQLIVDLVGGLNLDKKV